MESNILNDMGLDEQKMLGDAAMELAEVVGHADVVAHTDMEYWRDRADALDERVLEARVRLKVAEAALSRDLDLFTSEQNELAEAVFGSLEIMRDAIRILELDGMI